MDSTGLLRRDIDWVRQVIGFRTDQLENKQLSQKELDPPEISSSDRDNYATMVTEHSLNPSERLILTLSVLPYVASEYLDNLCVKNPVTGSIFTELGGRFSDASSGFIPTGDTAVYLIAGSDLAVRLQVQMLLDKDGRLFAGNLLKLDQVSIGTPPMTARLIPTEECLHKILFQKNYRPDYAPHFPAKLLQTRLTWDDLVLPYDIYESLDELDAWLDHHDKLEQMPEVNKKFKRGYRALFYGPPGTGKTLTASLMGNKYALDVYHIDLSMLVSKYIGETEKNLKHIFDIAENKQWILFFDEADAIFGKRTQTQSSNDRYANQEVSYLLQRVEDYPGLIVLASNLKSNMDKAFLRRFQSIIYFPMPGPEERYELWQKAFADVLQLESTINLRKISKDYELSGAAIGNILRYCTLMALKRSSPEVKEQDLLNGIRREMSKEGKVS
ncbi:ATP-binding protein [Fulvivirga sp. M361]|uniref:ATP-binding protein n=1 Tax=Fulvivirga sp. M361 TaxID=2594266 RepID=UPI001179D78A|nr:ATP-binding protein [Fulvivirga sp. M361]TRX58285.1 ATP-binding protein [Fulvivirga sp. M361]